LEKFGAQLYQRLRELRVDSIEPETSGQALAGAKGDPITFTSLAVTLLTPLLPKAIDVVRDLLKERKDRQVELKIGGVSATLPSDVSPTDVARTVALLTSAAERTSF
jgi:hypothetical protein